MIARMIVDPDELIIKRTSRVPLPDGPAGDGSAAVRQFDAVLMSAGFKLSPELFTSLAAFSEATVIDTAVRVLDIVRRMVGDHVQHNVYFRDFPRNVPDTVDFWMECLIEALLDPVAGRQVEDEMVFGTLNLLSLPKYGRYHHNFAEMLAAQPDFVAAATDRVTVLHAGETLAAEMSRMYLALAVRPTALNEDDAAALTTLAYACASDPQQPSEIPVRETRALINRVRLGQGAELLLDTVTDVLRLACAWCGGDVTLREPTRFAGIARRDRRALLAGLDRLVAANPAKLADVMRHREQWKRLGERLHPHEYPDLASAARVFAAARGEMNVPTFASRVEALLAEGQVTAAATLLQAAPGLLLRSLDRLLRSCETARDQHAVVDAVKACMSGASGPMLLSARAYVMNRTVANPARRRVFVNSRGRGHVTVDARQAIDFAVFDYLAGMFDDEIRSRLPAVERLVVDPSMLTVALPLSGKSTTGGFGVLPRGSVSPVDGQLLRFFIYWKERAERTDFDLSALMLDADFRNPNWLSYTNLQTGGGVHSGDIVAAPQGASEFIDIDLAKVDAHVVIPEVHVFDGEGFGDVEESFFGFMVRDEEQEGHPFEPRTVRMKSDLRGRGRVALPVAFVRVSDGHWRAEWLHLHLPGFPRFNRVETTSATATDLVRAVIDRKYLTVAYLVDLHGARVVAPEEAGDAPVTYLGLSAPEALPAGSTVITPANLADLLPV